MSLSSEIEHLYNLIDKKEQLISKYVKMNRNVKAAIEELKDGRECAIKANRILGESYQSNEADIKNEQIYTYANKIGSMTSLLNNILGKSQKRIKDLQTEIEDLRLEIEDLRAQIIANAEG